MNKEIQDCLELLARDQVALACVAVFSPFFEADKEANRLASTAVWLNAWATTGSSPYRSRLELDIMIRALAPDGSMPSRRSIARALALPETSPDLDREAKALDRMAKTTSAQTDLCIDLVNDSIRALGWQPGDLYVTIDGRLRPFWGIGNMVRKRLEHHITRLSNAGRLTSPAIRGKKLQMDEKIVRKNIPKWDGTFWGHQWLHLSLHHWETKESFPLVVQFKKGNLEDQVAEAMEALKRLETTPLAILVDREFTQNYDVMKRLGEYADPRGVYVVGPMRRFQGLEKKIQDEWDSGRAQFIEEAGETLYMSCSDHTPSSRPDAPHHIVFLYTLGQLRVDIEVEAPNSVVHEAEDDEYSIRGIGFYCNRPVSLDQALWFSKLYARRWACESLFMRHITMMGKSQSGDQATRHFGYAGAFLLLAVYGQWRAVRRRLDKPGKEYPPEHSHTAFFAHLKAGLLTLLSQPDS